MAVRRLGAWEGLNFVLTNRIPRRQLTRFVGWLSKNENPLVRDLSLAAWRLMTDLDLSDSAETEFRSVHACFTRKLRPGARPLDPDPHALVSPCDGILVAAGEIHGSTLLQAKGLTYTLDELLADTTSAARYRDGYYATVRLPSSVYHRFHAPCDGVIRRVKWFPGDTWNTNPAALRRVDRLYCRNERAAIELELASGRGVITLVPVAAILVASLRLSFLDLRLHLGYRGPSVIDCAVPVARGDELGWFEHGSTIIALAPPGMRVAPGLGAGSTIRMGQALFHSTWRGGSA